MEERKREDMRPLGGTDSRAHGSRGALPFRTFCGVCWLLSLPAGLLAEKYGSAEAYFALTRE